MLSFLEVEFGGNLVQGFRVYAWRAVPSFPQIALYFPSFALRPQPFWRIRLHSHAHATKSKMRSGSKVQWPTSVYIKPSSKWTWVTLNWPFQFLQLRQRAVDRYMRHQCHSGQPLIMYCLLFKSDVIICTNFSTKILLLEGLGAEWQPSSEIST